MSDREATIHPNGKNLINIGVNSRTSNSDTLYYSGIDSDTHWKEAVYPNLVVGYLNVGAERLAEFDSAIYTLRRIER